MCAYARVYVRVCVIVCSKLLALQLSDLCRHKDITILQCLNEYNIDMTIELNSVIFINRERVQ